MKNKKRFLEKNIFLISLLFFLIKFSFGQNQWVIYTPQNSGLPDSFVNGILIDSNNVKWITTSNGFAKLQGNTWTVYDTTNSGLPHNTCGGVTQDKTNKIWLNTYGKGIAKFDGVNWTVYNLENTGMPINHTTSIAFDNINTKWIGGIGVFNFNDTLWLRYYTGNSGIPSNMVTNVFMEGNILWVATADAGMGRFDGQDWIVYNNNNSGLPSNWVYMIKMDSYNNKWIATFFGGVAKFNFSQNLWTVYNTGNSGLHDNNTFSIYVDNNNVKWIGASGCARYNDTNWQIFLYSFIGDVFNFAKDKYGNMWICTTRGLYVYNPTGVIGINNNTSVISDNFDLFQNYPNPFNSISKIKYQLSNIQIKNQKVKLIIFNSIGQKLMTLVDKVQTPGIYEISFDGSNLASGIYFYQLQVNDFMQVKKMVFLK